MKAKYLFLVALVALPLVSCKKESKSDDSKSANYQEMTFTASIPSVDGVSTAWAAGDAISVFDGKANQKFTASGAGQSASFVGTANADATEFMAVSPYSSSLSRKSGKVDLSVATSQTAVAGGFNPSYNYAVAYTTAADFKFTNVVAYVKFNINTPGFNVLSATIEAIGGEAIAGDMTVSLSSTPEVTVGSGSSKVSVAGSNMSGVYYAVVAPASLSQGIKVAITDSNDSRAEVEIPSATLKMGEVTDLGEIAPTDWKEAVNPDPTAVAGAIIMKASFESADFNLVNDGGFEDYPNDTWIPTSATTVSQIDGYNSPKAIRIERAGADATMTNFEQGCKWQMGNEDTRWIMEFDARVPADASITCNFYSGFGFFDDYGCWWKEVNGWPPTAADIVENSRYFFNDGSWHHYVLDDTCYRGQYKGEVHVGMWGDVASWAEYDNLIAYPYGYDYQGTSTEPTACDVLGRVTNATYDEVDDLGKVVAWMDEDGNVKLAFSNVSINGTVYPTAIACTESTDPSSIQISKFQKTSGAIDEIVPLAVGQISMVPDDVFTQDGKTYMHYYTTISEDPALSYSWVTDASGFAVSEDNGKTWTPASKMWAGSAWANNNDGKFSNATFVNREGYTYMVGSYAGRDNWAWGETFAARIADGGDITDPDAYEYWTNNPAAGAWVTGGEFAIGNTACAMQGDRGINDIVWNPKFGVYQLFYRADRVNGILYRDSKGPDADGNWYWSGAKLLCLDENTGYLGSVSVLKVNEDGSVILLGSQLPE